jgi:hypothetical protein
MFVHKRAGPAAMQDLTPTMGNYAYILLIVTAFFLESFSTTPTPDYLSLEDFQSYNVGDIPEGWQEIQKRSLIKLRRRTSNDNADFAIAEDSTSRYIRLSSKNGVARIVRTLQEGPEWDLETHPELQWSWRAHRLPEGASEEDLNDVCAAVYVTYSINFLRLPKSIKYTYSSTLPVGTVVNFRRLKVLVVASGKDDLDKWKHESRNVAEDYRQLFGEEPPRYPLAVTLSSDSDTTEDASEADFDEIRFAAAD